MTNALRRSRARRNSSRGALWPISANVNDYPHAINYRLKDLEQRLDRSRFIRLGRGTLANVDLITKISVMPGRTHVAILNTGQP
jgi:LytTr DNA-binding domain